MKCFAQLPKWFAFAAIGAALALFAPRAGGEPVASWDLAPYRIELLIAAQPGGAVPRNLVSDLRADLPALVEAVVGGVWRLDAAAAPAELEHSMLTGISEVTADRLPEEARAHDKVMLLGIAQHQSGIRLEAREFDVTTGVWNSVITRDVAQAEEIGSAALHTMLAAFAPVARIESAEKGTASLRIKGGAIARRDQSLAAISSGAVFRPVLIDLDNAGVPQPKTSQPIDWTLLTVTSSGGSIATCRIDTGLAGEPIPAYHPRRARLAVGASPSGKSTRLTLVSRGASAAPLEGIEVLATDPEAASDARAKSLGISDLAGVIVVPPGASTVRLLDVRQGSQTLARVPLVPGLAGAVQLALADDRQRLAIDTMLAEAEDALIDLAARRQALATRIKLARKTNEAGADALVAKLRALATVEPQLAVLARAEKAVQAADPAAQALLQPKLAALQNLAKLLAAQSPTALLEAPKPTETKPADSKPTDAKPAEAKSAENKK